MDFYLRGVEVAHVQSSSELLVSVPTSTAESAARILHHYTTAENAAYESSAELPEWWLTLCVVQLVDEHFSIQWQVVKGALEAVLHRSAMQNDSMLEQQMQRLKKLESDIMSMIPSLHCIQEISSSAENDSDRELLLEVGIPRAVSVLKMKTALGILTSRSTSSLRLFHQADEIELQGEGLDIAATLGCFPVKFQDIQYRSSGLRGESRA